jgi:DNA-directed RNA polymerase subunit RPC12/RpoP
MYRLTTPEGECLTLNSYGVECVCTPDENCDEGCLNQRIARLAQYEDTGLTPEQVTELKERQSERHGKWEEITEYGGWGETHYRCSVCGEEWHLDDGKPADNNMNFCPKCGARMDKLQGE